MRAFFFMAVMMGIASASALAEELVKSGRIGLDSASSACIGSNATPVCAAETLLACLFRADGTLCRQAGLDPRTITREPTIVATEYAIDRVSVIRAEDVTEDLRDVDWFKPGFALVELRQRMCRAADCEDADWDDVQVYAQPVDNGWRIVTWRGDIGQENAPDIPDAFRAKQP